METRKEIKRLARQSKNSLTQKYNNLKDDIIAELSKMEEKGFSRFKKPISVPTQICGEERKIHFKGLKRIDIHLHFEGPRKTLYECSVATVDGLMTVVEKINDELLLDNNHQLDHNIK